MNLPLSLSTPPRPPGENRRPYFAVYLLLASLTAVVYAPLRQAGFSDGAIVDIAFRLQGALQDSLPWMFADGRSSPLGWISHWVDFQLHGLDPTGHHLTSLVLHLLNTVLLFGLLWRVFSNLVAAAIAAALFAVHPVNVDAVAWIAGRQYVLSLFFWLILLRVYLDWVDENRTTTYLSMMVLSLLGSLAGPRVFIVAPVVLLLMDAWPLKRMGAGVERPADAGPPLLARIREKIPLCGVAALVPSVLWVVGTEAGRYGEAPVGISVLAAKLTGPGFLLAAFFCLPSPASLGAAAPPIVQASVAFLLLCGISAAVAAAGKRCSAMLTGWIWFLATALFAATPIGTGAGTTHPWGYLPVAGLIFLVAAMGSAADGGRNQSRIAVAVLGVGMVFLLALNAGAKLDQWSRSSSVSQSAGTIRLSNGWPTKISTLTGTVAVRYPPD